MLKKITQNFYNIFERLIPVGGLIFLAAQIIVAFTSEKAFQSWSFWPLSILNIIAAICCIILIINPKKTIIYCIIGILYTVLFSFMDMNEISIFMCYTVSQLGLYDQSKTLEKYKKYAVFSILFLIFIIAVRCFLYKGEYISRLFAIWPYLFALAIIIFIAFRNIYAYEIYKKRTIIDLDKFDELSERQKDLIFCILDDVKYDSFARDHNISNSAIKKDAVELFRIFNTNDKNSFVLKYSRCDFLRNGKVVYTGKKPDLKQFH